MNASFSESFESRSELVDAQGRPDAELNDMLHKVAGMTTERAFTGRIESNTAAEAAHATLHGAAALGALGYTTRAAEQLAAFDTLALPETPDAASIYTGYRSERIRALLRDGADTQDVRVQAIIAEQEASPVQTTETSIDMYRHLAGEGDLPSFSKWFHVLSETMADSTEQASPQDPFPPLPEWTAVATVIKEQVHSANDTPEVDGVRICRQHAESTVC